jgi:hypothetical protein
MTENLFKSLSLVDVSGSIIIAAIVALLVAAVALTFFLRGRYARIESDLEQHAGSGGFEELVLERIVRAAGEAQARSSEVNTQAIIDQHFQTELRGLLIGERFVKAATGLMIILGLVGTFYGLTLSIGKLVGLVSGDLTSAAEITQSLTRGLTDALAGMSVAFSTSLFGIVAAIIQTLVSVFFSVPDRRGAAMVRIETYLDNVLLRAAAPAQSSVQQGGGAAPDARLAEMTREFGLSVARLDGVVAKFESALVSFSSSTRDFQEFNHHLKDNIQRMSLSFGDLSDTLKQQAGAMRRERS